MWLRNNCHHKGKYDYDPAQDSSKNTHAFKYILLLSVPSSENAGFLVFKAISRIHEKQLPGRNGSQAENYHSKHEPQLFRYV